MAIPDALSALVVWVVEDFMVWFVGIISLTSDSVFRYNNMGIPSFGYNKHVCHAI